MREIIKMVNMRFSLGARPDTSFQADDLTAGVVVPKNPMECSPLGKRRWKSKFLKKGGLIIIQAGR